MARFTLFISAFIILFQAHTSTLFAQSTEAEKIEHEVLRSDIEKNIYFLAADELLGRDTGTQEIDIAARYIATWFQVYGVEMADGYDSYFQNVPFERLKAPDEIAFAIGDSTYQQNRDLVLMNSFRGDLEADYIFLEYASLEELSEHDVEGKIVIARAGLADHTSPQQNFMTIGQKNGWVKEAGGKALIELYTSQQFPWQILVNFLSGDRVDLRSSDMDEDDTLPHFWMNGTIAERIEYVSESTGSAVEISVDGEEPESFYSRNVVGVIRGTDETLRDEYILLGAHYDHTGVVDGHPEPITSEYIYNGARDNAVGTAGIMAAAKYFAANPPERSLIFAAWTAEEIGLLGSRYYAENPMVPLEQTIYNLNIDGAGYNDTTKVTVIGLGRTEADDEMIAAAEAFGLEAIPDPVPEQNLFDRSDNVNFAQRGIPAPTYSMGLTAFDDEINYYYHQPTDEPHTLDYDYVTRYIRSFVLAAQSIANRDTAPFWLPGDVYEEAGIELFGVH
ncbi:MAG: M28 family peptidase [Balneolaceae bacterium]|nr:MAG: M28 family peptidase [Balneolaceae bacterium]